ncbi:hypothetical protein HYH03_005962 [Edaphochlamys debaryana]|uniref:RNase III domain-containing protein n=1 Tax=Edaphochlamys debaryana TaxID=47281 RepID=A0A835Y8A5_9CHLO|nr:hypothetical protein HYH03_005962 [Edaphochlamys debaryana]|eukprot:KAG2496041.1 hypothetical protein HYH03_005962 [Edaphochlamys debaryana]
MLNRANLVGNQAARTPQQLAYLGDAVWSLHVRCKYLTPPKQFASYRSSAERHVSAAKQAAYLDSLLASGWQLTPAEAQLVEWAQRTPSSSLTLRAKYSAAGGQQGAYRRATAFEALLGHLSLEDPPRLQELLQRLDPALADVDRRDGAGGR